MRFDLLSLAAVGCSVASAEPLPRHESPEFVLPRAVAPGSNVTGLGDWTAAYAKANRALKALNLTEKVGLVTGVGWQNGPCVGNTYKPNSLDYPSLCLQDSPLGVRYAQGVTAFPPGVMAASTWDRALIKQRGAGIGEEAKGLGVNVILGPVAGPLGKNARGGRGWEGFSPDPYLTGTAMQQSIDGIQGAGAQACAKHFIGNEQEFSRDTMTSNIDDRTLHELYLWPFADAVKANVASVMCSYNQLDGQWACENDHYSNAILKKELSFPGYLMSDWNAQHTTVNSALSGLDMAMPGGDFSGNPDSVLWGPRLIAAVNNGTVPKARLDDMVRRILASWYLLGQDQAYPPVEFVSWNNGTGGPDVQANHKEVVRDIARDGIVLLKNSKNVLPLKKPGSLAIIGSDAIVNPDGPNACPDRGCDNGTLAMGWGSGTDEFPYLIGPYDAIKAQAAKDGTKLVTSTTDSPTEGASAAMKASTALVFINADSGEEYITVEGAAGDRLNLDPWHNGNELVKAVAAANKNVIVVVHSVGPIIMESILSNPSVKAIVWAGLPGQESGNGLADILYGSASPSGKLPYTIAKQPSDYSSDITGLTDTYSEGLFIDYRHFDKSNIAPRYEFGFGLSYTKFQYSSLHVQSGYGLTSGATRGPVAPGGPEDLYQTVATVTASIRNTGHVAGKEVAQLYIGLPSGAPDAPPRQLRGFQKLSLQPGRSGTASFDLRRKDLSYWDASKKQWVVPKGTFKVWVGASSRDLKLSGELRVN